MFVWHISGSPLRNNKFPRIYLILVCPTIHDKNGNIKPIFLEETCLIRNNKFPRMYLILSRPTIHDKYGRIKPIFLEETCHICDRQQRKQA